MNRRDYNKDITNVEPLDILVKSICLLLFISVFSIVLIKIGIINAIFINIIVALIGAIGVIVSTFMGLSMYSRQSYNQHITSERILWLNKLKEQVAQFNTTIRLIELKETDKALENNDIDQKKYKEQDKNENLVEKLTSSYSKIVFALNPIDELADKEVLNSARLVYKKAYEVLVKEDGDSSDLSCLRIKFLENARVLCKAEWDIIKKEAEKGLLENNEKNKEYQEIKGYKDEHDEASGESNVNKGESLERKVIQPDENIDILKNSSKISQNKNIRWIHMETKNKDK